MKRYSHLLESICNNATLALFIMDERQHCIYMNPAAERLTGYTLAEVAGKSLHDVLHHTRPDGSAYPSHECPIARAYPLENREHGEEVFVRKDNSFYPVAFVASPIIENGETRGTIIEARDISGEKAQQAEYDELLRRERAAREESETIRRIGQLISGELDLQKVVQAVTDAATDITGAEFGAFFYNVFDDHSGERFMLYSLSGAAREDFENFGMPRPTDVFRPTFHNEGTIRSGDIRQDQRFGKNHPHNGMPHGHLPVASYLGVSVVSRSGEVLGGLLFGHHEKNVFTERHERIVEAMAAQAAIAMDNARLFETAQRMRAEAEAHAHENERLLKEAREADQLKDEFLATVSHELRTPLNAILGWSSMLMTNTLDAAMTKRGLETINRNCRAQAQIIEDILDVSRIITGKLRLDARVIELATVIESAVDALAHAAEAKGVQLQMLLDRGGALVSGDPDRLQQVVWNLVSNALKFTARDGLVQIRLERVDAHAQITISDTGIGIAPDFVPFVFDRFRQADSSSSRKHGGLGLGLAIVRQLVELHGGSVAAHSDGLGSGATFTIKLPLVALKNRRATDAPDSERAIANSDRDRLFDCPPQLENLRVLIVDDEKDSRDLLQDLLEQCGAIVFAASSAAEAFAAVEDFKPQVLVSDIGMPGEDGYELIARIRAREKACSAKRIPAVALTAYARVEDRLRALSASFQMHVPKPIEPAELIAVIASLANWETNP